MIQSLLTQLSKQTKFIKNNTVIIAREVLASRNSMQSKTNNQSANNIVPNQDESFQRRQLLMKLFYKLNLSLKKFW